MQHRFVVAIVHTDEAVRASLAAVLQEQGFSAITTSLADLVETPDEAERFLRRNNPDVIVYDVSPWDESVPFLAFLRRTKASAGRSFILTTTDDHTHEPLLREAIDLRSCPHAIDTLLLAVDRAASMKIQRAAS